RPPRSTLFPYTTLFRSHRVPDLMAHARDKLRLRGVCPLQFFGALTDRLLKNLGSLLQRTHPKPDDSEKRERAGERIRRIGAGRAPPGRGNVETEHGGGPGFAGVRLK